MDDEVAMTTTHPSEERLIAYASDELRGGDATAIADHLVGCAACTGTVARYRMVRDFVRADEAFIPSAAAVTRAKSLFTALAPAPVRDRNFFAPLRRIVAELVFDSGGGFAPALAGFRGAGDRHLTYEAETIEIEVQATPVEPGDEWRVLGQLAADRDLDPVAIQIVAAGGIDTVARAMSDEHGMFEVRLPAGRYELVARFPDIEVVVPILELG
jgi:anti-sigma factor RsiW